MSLTFPRDMITGWRWPVALFGVLERQELSRQANGVAQGKDLGPSIWRAEFRSRQYSLADAEALEADFLTLRGLTETFYAYPYNRRIPAAIHDASGYALSSLTIDTVRADRMGIKITGFPAAFAMTRGDFVSITTAAGGRELVKLASSAVADGAGLTPYLELTRPLRTGVADEDVVAVVNPMAEMRLEPGTLSLDPGDGLNAAVSFSAVQHII